MSISKRLEDARRAYLQGDLQASAQAHEKQRIIQAAREEHGAESSKYIQHVVYGGLDGVITTFAVVSGVVGAQLNPGVIIILGLANLLGDGFSMATGAYLSSKSEHEYYEKERLREQWEIEHFPAGEKQELLEIYLHQGYPESDAKKIVDVKTAEKTRWLNAMMVEELSLLKDETSPLAGALATFLAFLVTGSLPLLIYLLSLLFKFNLSDSSTFSISLGLSAVALFSLGAAKYFVTKRNPILSGLEMLVVGGFAAAVAYLVGALLKGIGG